jgi:ADP-ribosyl-[dinitrogen reductase] hydrolase
MEDRAVGALLGLAAGDAVGTTLEFATRDSRPLLTDMTGGGPFRLKPGEWTDDTAMALALADSLSAHGDLSEQDLLGRFSDWWRNGTYSCTGSCFDIGITTRQAISEWEVTKADHCGSADPLAAGNGSLMRLAPIPIRYWRDRPKLRDAAARQSKTTHAAPEAVDACVVYAEMIADAIEGKPRSAVLAARKGEWAGSIAGINGGSWRGKQRADINASGYVAHAMEASLWAAGRCPDFKRAVLLAANLGQDADTTAAITGQLAGALAGTAALPAAWLEKLALRPRLHRVATGLFKDALAT